MNIYNIFFQGLHTNDIKSNQMFLCKFSFKSKRKKWKVFFGIFKKQLPKKQGFWIGLARFRTHVHANCQMIT